MRPCGFTPIKMINKQTVRTVISSNEPAIIFMSLNDDNIFETKMWTEVKSTNQLQYKHSLITPKMQKKNNDASHVVELLKKTVIAEPYCDYR